MTAAAMLAGAMVLDALLGEPDWLWRRMPHPAVLMGQAISRAEKRLNAGLARQAKGVAMLILLILAVLAVGLLLRLIGPVAEMMAAAILLAQRSLVDHVRDVARGMAISPAEGRQQVARIVSRNTDQMTEPEIARAAIESAAENLSDGVIAPAFWFLVAGAPGILIYKAVNTADSMIGYRTPRYAAFGWAAARLDDLLNLIPARLTALLILATDPRRWPGSGLVADALAHKSPNAGWPEAAMARRLDLALAGPRRYDGALLDLAWVNATARKDATAADIDRAVSILWQVWSIALVLVLTMLLIQS